MKLRTLESQKSMPFFTLAYWNHENKNSVENCLTKFAKLSTSKVVILQYRLYKLCNVHCSLGSQKPRRNPSILIINKIWKGQHLPVALVQVPNDLVLEPQHLPEQEDCMEHWPVHHLCKHEPARWKVREGCRDQRNLMASSCNKLQIR